MWDESLKTLDQKLGWRKPTKKISAKLAYLNGLPPADLNDTDTVLANLHQGISDIESEFSHQTEKELRQSEEFTARTNGLFEKLGPEIWPEEGTEPPSFVDPRLELYLSNPDHLQRLRKWFLERMTIAVLLYRASVKRYTTGDRAQQLHVPHVLVYHEKDIQIYTQDLSTGRLTIVDDLANFCKEMQGISLPLPTPLPPHVIIEIEYMGDALLDNAESFFTIVRILETQCTRITVLLAYADGKIGYENQRSDIKRVVKRNIFPSSPSEGMRFNKDNSEFVTACKQYRSESSRGIERAKFWCMSSRKNTEQLLRNMKEQGQDVNDVWDMSDMFDAHINGVIACNTTYPPLQPSILGDDEFAGEWIVYSTGAESVERQIHLHHQPSATYLA